MAIWAVQVEVMPKKGILNPQGSTVQEALLTMGYAGVKDMRIGKKMHFLYQGSSSQEVEKAVAKMCHELLANPVIEDYTFTIEAREDGEG